MLVCVRYMDQPYWMVKAVLYLSVIKIDGNLIDVVCNSKPPEAYRSEM